METQKPKFLVVDDDKDIHNLMQAILTSLDCDCHCVKSGEEALELVSGKNDGSFDAIFIDLCMPTMSGLELSEKLRADPTTQSIPRIMLTALEKYDDIMRGYEAGGDYYLTKPVTTGQLTYALDLIFGDDGSNNKKIHSLPEA